MLHLRNIKAMYDLIDSSEGSIAVVPHRMNVSCSLLQDISYLILHGLDIPSENHLPRVSAVFVGQPEVRSDSREGRGAGGRESQSHSRKLL